MIKYHYLNTMILLDDITKICKMDGTQTLLDSSQYNMILISQHLYEQLSVSVVEWRLHHH